MTCEVCGPLPPDREGRTILHDRCHDQEHTMMVGLREVQWTSRGCGHALDKHTDTMRCRVCHHDCGHTDQQVARIKEQVEDGTLFG